MRHTTLRFAAALATAAFLSGCSGYGEQPPTVINPEASAGASAVSVAPTEARSGIPSSGTGEKKKKKPDPVGALSPIVPTR